MNAFATSRARMLLLAALVIGANGIAAQSRVVIPSEVEVARDRMSFADLLPASAPETLRARGTTIDLGRAPHAGTTRRIARREVLTAIAGEPGMASLMDVPPAILVRRLARSISVDEVREAIRRSIATGQAGAASELLGEITLLSAPLATEPGELTLEVSDAACDGATSRSNFRLRAANDTDFMPFLASVEGCAASALFARPAQVGPAEAAKHRLDRSLARNRRAPRGEILAAPGKPARLVTEGAGFRVSTPVVPLERGASGERIRVRLPDSRRVLFAIVVGPGLLRAE